METMRYKDYVFRYDKKATESLYLDRLIVFEDAINYIPELTSFLTEFGIDIRKPIISDKDDLFDTVYFCVGKFETETGYEIDFTSPGKLVNCVFYQKDDRFVIELFGLGV